MELIPVNMQMGLSTLDVNQGLNRSVHGFWFSQKLIFCNSMNTKKASPFGLYNVRTPICAIANQSIDGAFLEKDFKFEPTFEGYLEAMEIARTGRDKKSSRDASGRRFKKNGGWVGNDDVSRFESNGYEENADFVDGYPRQNFDSVVRVKHGNSEKTSDSYGNSAGTGRVWTRSKVGCRERVGDLRDLNVVKRSPGNRDLERRDMGYNGSYAFHGFDKRGGEERTNYADTGKKELRPNGRWIRTQINTVEKKTGGSEINKTLLEMESLHRRMDGNKRGIFLRNRQSRICEIESDRRERTTTYHSGTRNRWQGDAAEIDELTLRSIKLETRSRRSDFQTERSVAGRNLVKNQDSRKPTRVLRTEVEGSNPDMERKAFKTFEVFTDVRNRPRVLRMEMEERIQNLAKWLNGTSVYLSEWQFSKMMHSADIKFTDHSILRVVQILGELGNWRRVLQVVQWLQSRERFKSYKSKYIYTTVLNVLGKARRPVEALNVFHAMRQELSSYPDMAAYHCIAVTLGQVGYMKELFDVIDCMRSVPDKLNKRTIEKWDPRLEPDAVVYNAVLNACVLRKQWEGAFWVLQQLKQQGTRPSSTTYGLVMEVMLACGKYNLVHEFFRKVEKSSIPNTLTYKVLVNALWREGRTDEAVLAVQDMERRGIVGSASLYYDLARCLCSAGRCQEALTQVDKLCKVATKPLLVTYTGLIKACMDSGNVNDGAYIFNHMHKFCSPNLITYNTMLRSYVQHKMFKEAMDLFEKILNGGGIGGRRKRPLPEHFTFNTMLEACAVEKRWDDFDNIYRRMLHHGYVFDAKHHLSAILAASRAGKGQLLHTTWDHLVRSNRVVPTAIVKEMFCQRLQEDDIPAAISCLSYQPNVLPAFSEEAWLELFSRNADRFQKESLVTLLHEVSAVIDENDKSNTIFVNLANSCREVLNANV